MVNIKLFHYYIESIKYRILLRVPIYWWILSFLALFAGLALVVPFIVVAPSGGSSSFLYSVLPNIIGGIYMFCLTAPIFIATVGSGVLSSVFEKLSTMREFVQKHKYRGRAEEPLIYEKSSIVLKDFSKIASRIKYWVWCSILFLFVSLICDSFRVQWALVATYILSTLTVMYAIYIACMKHQEYLFIKKSGNELALYIEVNACLETLERDFCGDYDEVTARGLYVDNDVEAVVADLLLKRQHAFAALSLGEWDAIKPWHRIAAINRNIDQDGVPYIEVHPVFDFKYDTGLVENILNALHFQLAQPNCTFSESIRRAYLETSPDIPEEVHVYYYGLIFEKLAKLDMACLNRAYLINTNPPRVWASGAYMNRDELCIHVLNRLLQWSLPAKKESSQRVANNDHSLRSELKQCHRHLARRIQYFSKPIDSNIQIEYNIKNPIEGERMRT